MAFTLAGVAVAAPLLVLAAALPAAVAARLRPHVAGDAGDVFDDLGFGRTDPWRFARRVAIGLGLVVLLVAAVQGDPFDGAAQRNRRGARVPRRASRRSAAISACAR